MARSGLIFGASRGWQAEPRSLDHVLDLPLHREHEERDEVPAARNHVARAHMRSSYHMLRSHGRREGGGEAAGGT